MKSRSVQFSMKAAHLRKTIAQCALTTVLISSLPVGSKSAGAQTVMTQSAGSLDTSFGNSGKVVTDFGGQIAEAYSIALQPDGKFIVAGHNTNNGGSAFALARYNSDGSLDSSFGAAGKVTTVFPQGESEILAMVLQQDGKIVAAGDVGVSANHGAMAVARYNADGTLDSGFGSSGEVTVDFGTGIHTAYAVAIQTDGSIIIAGTALLIFPDLGSSQFGLARLSPNGTLDLSFGNGGMATGPSISPVNGFRGFTIQPDGKLVGSGYSGATRSSAHWAVVRYNPNGTLDAGFGVGGVLTTDSFGPGATARGPLALGDGKLVVTGTSLTTPINYNFALARYNVDGTLDPTFGIGGVVTTSFPGGVAAGIGAELQADGRILLTGSFRSSPSDSNTSDFALARYNPDGSLDQGFGTGGLVTTDFNGLFDEAWAVAVQPDGNILVAGEAQKTPGPNPTIYFALVRYSGGSALFSLAPAAATVTGNRGTKVKVTISINRSVGFTGSVTITPPDSAQGIKFKPPDPVATTDSSVAFKLKISGSAPTGLQQLTFIGRSDDGQVSTATLTLNIQ